MPNTCPSRMLARVACRFLQVRGSNRLEKLNLLTGLSMVGLLPDRPVSDALRRSFQARHNKGSDDELRDSHYECGRTVPSLGCMSGPTP